MKKDHFKQKFLLWLLVPFNVKTSGNSILEGLGEWSFQNLHPTVVGVCLNYLVRNIQSNFARIKNIQIILSSSVFSIAVHIQPVNKGPTLHYVTPF